MNDDKNDNGYYNYLDMRSTGMYWERMEEFDKSYYKNVYENAFLQLKNIIAQNSQQTGFYENRGRMKKTTGHDVSYEKYSNIMAFVGGRGTGKTSVMLSFMEALRSYNGKNQKKNNQFTFDNENILFTCLDCIDGSLLEHGEDIFKIVLAQLYQKFIDIESNNELRKKDDFDYRKRELLKKLEGIYKTVCDIENMEKAGVFSGESYMTNLQSLSSSQKVKKEFQSLITIFTDIMKYEGSLIESNEHYVVITVDDIDLNIKHGFSMLEKIHRYCMVPNVIVLLSMDMKQMIKITMKNFYKAIPGKDFLMEEEGKDIHKLAIDYLDKVISVNYRIYLPDITDHYTSSFVSIKGENVGIKHTIFGKLYRRTGICFDSQGKKRHFYEPNSMRQLKGLYLMLESMKPAKLEILYGKEPKGDNARKEAEESVHLWENNCRILEADISQRMAYYKIYDNKDALELYESIVRVDVDRAKNMIVKFCLDEKKKLKKTKLKTNEETEYSYGELVEAIYDLGRIENDEYKPLVHCLLAYLSYAFTRTYLFEKFQIKDQNNKELAPKGELKRLMLGSLTKKWSKAFLPKTPLYITDAVSESSNSKSNIDFIQYASFKDVILSKIFNIELDEQKLNENTWSWEYVAKIICDMEVLLLFFGNIKDNQDAIKVWDDFDVEFEIERNKFDGLSLKMKEIKEDKQSQITYVGEFNITNLIMNSMYASKYLEKVERNLINCFEEQYIKTMGKKKKTKKDKENFEDEMNKHSLKRKYVKWEEDYGEAAVPLPVYWIDFTYNVLKRTKKNLAKENPETMTIDEAFECIAKIYQCIDKQLEEQQAFYYLEQEKANQEPSNEKREAKVVIYPDKLQDIFKKCPVIVYFLEVKKNDKKTLHGNNGNTQEDDYTHRKKFIEKVMNNLRQFSVEV